MNPTRGPPHMSAPTQLSNRKPEGFIRKYERAYEHFTVLDKEIGGFLKSAPYELVPELNADATGHRLIAHVRAYPDPQWSIRIGECLFNFRSALDHLAWRLAIDFSGHGDQNVTEFPIFIDGNKYGQ